MAGELKVYEFDVQSYMKGALRIVDNLDCNCFPIGTDIAF